MSDEFFMEKMTPSLELQATLKAMSVGSEAEEGFPYVSQEFDPTEDVQEDEMISVSDFPLDILNANPIKPAFSEVLGDDGEITNFIINPMSDACRGLLEPDVCGNCPYSNCSNVLPSIARLATTPITEPMKMVLVGEGAGQVEEQLGVGFVGQSGQLLFNLFGKVFNVNFPNSLVTNAVWCRPPENETPGAKVLKTCSSSYLLPILMHSALVADDAIIVCIGKSAWTAVHNLATNGIKAPSILTAHSFHTELDFVTKDIAGDEVARHFRVFPMIHPAYILRTGKPELLAEDISSLFDLYFNVPSSISEARKGFDEVRKKITKGAKLIKDPMTAKEMDDLVQLINDSHDPNSELPPVISFDVEGRNTSPCDISNYLTLAGFGISETQGVQFVDTGLNNLRQLFLRFRDEGFVIVGQNIYYDFMMLYRQQILKSTDDLPFYFDTMIMHHLIDENSPAGLKYLLQKYHGWPDYGAELEPHLKEVGNDYGKLPFKVLQPYHALDICGNRLLFNTLFSMVYSEKVSGQWKIDYLELTHTLDRYLLQAAMNGMTVDRGIQAELSAELKEIISRTTASLDTPYTKRLVYTISQMSKELKEMVTKSLSDFPVADALPEDEKTLSKIEPFNPGSTQQLVMFLAATLSSPVKLFLKNTLRGDLFTPKGAIAVGDAVIESMVAAFDKLPKGMPEEDQATIPYVKEVLDTVREYRAATKLNSTYLDGMLTHLWHDDKVRAHWKVTGTVTGRLSANSPNLQNIPRGGIVKIKDMFVCSRPNYIMMNFDLSQAEMRGLASASGDENLAKAYREGLDMHKYVGSMAFNKPYADITKEERQASKSLGFGSIYGSGPRNLAAQIGMPVERAKTLLENFFKGFPKVQPWIEEQHRRLLDEGISLGILGRIRHLPPSLSKDPRDLSDLKREAQNFCADTDTEILTHLGWKRYDQLIVGENVPSFNMETGLIEADEILAVNVFKDGPYPCIEFKHPNISACTTLDHRWPVLKRSGNPQPTIWTTTKELDSRHKYHSIYRVGPNSKHDTESISDAELRVLGWVMTDANYCKTGTIRIAQSYKPNPHKVVSIRNTLDQAHLSYTEKVWTDSGETHIFYVHKCQFTSWMQEEFPERTLTPSFAFSLSTRQASILIDTMIMGDGNVKQKGRHTERSFCCSSQERADVFQILCVQAGVASSIRKITRDIGRKAYGRVPNKEGFITTKKPYYIIYLLSRDKAQVSEHHKKEVTRNIVWCPTTRNGTWISRRNGRMLITGNSIQNLASDFNLFIMKEVIERLQGEEESKRYTHPVYFINTVHDSTMWEVYGEPCDIANFYDLYFECVGVVNDMYREFVGDNWVDMAAEAELGLSWGKLKTLEKESDGDDLFTVKWEEKDAEGKKVAMETDLSLWLEQQLDGESL